MAVATEEKFEAVGFISDLSTNENKFTATLQDGTKLSGFKTKQDGSEAKVWPLVQRSMAEERYFRWTGNLRHGDKGQTYRNVTWGFELEDQPTTPQTGVQSQPEKVSLNDVAPELAEKLEGAHKASQALQNGKHEIDSYTFGSVSRVVAGLCSAGKLEKEEVLGELTRLYEAITDKPLLPEQPQ